MTSRIKTRWEHNNSVTVEKPERAAELANRGLVTVLEPERLKKALEALEDDHTFDYETAELDESETEKRTFGDDEDPEEDSDTAPDPKEDPEDESRQCGAETAEGDPCKNEIDLDENACWLHADDED